MARPPDCDRRTRQSRSPKPVSPGPGRRLEQLVLDPERRARAAEVPRAPAKEPERRPGTPEPGETAEIAPNRLGQRRAKSPLELVRECLPPQQLVLVVATGVRGGGASAPARLGEEA